MPVTLAVETATEACSVALQRNGNVFDRHERIPRQHNRRIFGLLEELFEEACLSAADLSAVTYGAGPGSFTGLRIASSLAQGLCFAQGIPAVPVSTLAVIAQTALDRDQIAACEDALVILDARVNEVYAAVVHFRDGCAELREGPWVTAPEMLACPDAAKLHLLQCGETSVDQLNVALQPTIDRVTSAVFPTARSMFPLVAPALTAGKYQCAHEIHPEYVQEEISWKKLSEQANPR